MCYNFRLRIATVQCDDLPDNGLPQGSSSPGIPQGLGESTNCNCCTPTDVRSIGVGTEVNIKCIMGRGYALLEVVEPINLYIRTSLFDWGRGDTNNFEADKS